VLLPIYFAVNWFAESGVFAGDVAFAVVVEFTCVVGTVCVVVAVGVLAIVLEGVELIVVLELDDEVGVVAAVPEVEPVVLPVDPDVLVVLEAELLGVIVDVFVVEFFVTVVLACEEEGVKLF
jgi:hypothetical protein